MTVKFSWVHVVPLLLLPVLICAAAGPAFAATESGDSLQFLEMSPCPFEAAAGLPAERLRCGRLTVPENRNNPHSATLSLPVAVIRTTSSEPALDPVVFIAGGPGGSPISSARTFELFASHAFNTNRDIVLYTQRGAAMTVPELDCQAISSRGSVYLENHSLAERDQAIANAATRCLREFADGGRDLQGYSATENARDLADLRRALGYRQWNMLAVSYGTLIAIETARIDPDGVRSMVLDSLVSPESDLFISEGNRNFSYALNRLFHSCASIPRCQERFPELRERLESVIAGLRETPVTLPLAIPGEAEPVQMSVNWHDFLGVVHWMMYNARTLTLVPLLIDETAAGRYLLLQTLLDRVFPGPMLADKSPAGSFFATVCRDQWTQRNPLPRTPSEYGGYSMAGFLELVCSDGSLDYGNASAPEPIPSNVPTLLLSGRFDPTTPDLYAEQVARVFTKVSLVRIPDFGHSTLSGYTACQTLLANAFLETLGDMSGYGCLGSLGPPAFVLSVEEAKALFTPGQE
ncbi:MAG: alpha/beta hydrolase [Xanthomonadales bacterium]|jgi:pimeloyl-ACP methyl ester carboxylesterase|nr:alpha/beta hydrolase [Xanthomonadales bacterium]